MIINYPTALYDSMIDTNHNITFTISNNRPPRTALKFSKIPVTIEQRQRASDQITATDRRKRYGELIYTTTSSTQYDGNQVKQYDIGQVIEFTASNTLILPSNQTSARTILRHDINTTDLVAIGLNNQSIDLIVNAATTALDALNITLNDLRRKRADAEIAIGIKQKLVSDANKTISALRVIQSNQTANVQSIIDELLNNVDKLESEIVSIIALATEYDNNANTILDNIRAISTMVQ